MTQDPSSIPFNRPFLVGKELFYISQAVLGGQLAGNGEFTRRCQGWMERRYGPRKVILTHSCTGALEMAALLCDLAPGDEVILPSYTFVSTANAFVLRGAVPVFVDIRPDTLNLDETKVQELVTPRTRAIVPVHYAGVACEMDAILEIARQHDLLVVEDAAQGVEATYRGRHLGSIGHLGCYSFHETKNYISGEGGALTINDRRFVERAEHLRDKGTDRQQFSEGLVDKYTWVDIGGSYPPSELVAAFLYAQLEEAERISTRRREIWQRYDSALRGEAARLELTLPTIPAHCSHNGHMYYVLFRPRPCAARPCGGSRTQGYARSSITSRCIRRPWGAVFPGGRPRCP
jgi:dTDP-4-amino-4,6-dideoxygalactose transaminase